MNPDLLTAPPPQVVLPQAAAATRSTRHLDYIDALRGWAFLAVLTVHAWQDAGEFPGRGLVLAGQYGVQLFFLASALTIFLSWRARRAERRPVRNFFIRRLCRIAPMFWLGIVFYGYWQHTWPGSGMTALPGWMFPATALFLHGWHFGSINAVVPGGWSIAVEMTFYATVPSLARFVGTRRQALFLWVGATAVGWELSLATFGGLVEADPRASRQALYTFCQDWFPMQFPVFVLGIVLYFLVTDARWMAWLSAGKRPAVLLGSSLFLLGFLSMIRMLPFYLALGKPLAFAVGLAGLVLALAVRPYGVFVNPVTRFFGRISFSAYLTHFAVLEALGSWPWIRHQIDADPTRLMPFAERMLLALPLVGGISFLTYRWIELPGMALGKRWIARLEQGMAAGRGSSAWALERWDQRTYRRAPMTTERSFDPVVPQEGWHVLHLFYHIEYGQWQLLGPDEQRQAKTNLSLLIQEIRATETTQLLAFSIVTPKADLGFMLLTPDLQTANQFEKRLTLSLGPDVLSPVYSYLSMTERSEYTTTEADYIAETLEKEKGLVAGTPEFDAGVDDFRSRMDKYGKDRLYPKLGNRPVICFYSMGKRRGEQQNWYRMPHGERKELMAGHARIGRQWAGKIRQLITGSTGLDDSEWGVTLFAHDTHDIKGIVYEMRFDAVSAEYADFGEFYIGLQLPLDELFRRILL